MAFRMNNWSDALDDQLIEKYRIKLSLINAGREDLAAWLKISLLSKLLSLIPPSFLPVKLLAYASNKRSWQLRKRLAAEGKRYDHIQAHNLGALYPAYYWAMQSSSTFSFDVEDFHPEEVISYQANWERKRRYRLMKELLPFATNITSASPMITKSTQELLPSKKVLTLNNSFFQEEFKIPKELDGSLPLKLIWFSQYITFNRGLEMIFEVIKQYKNEVNVTLVGELDPSFYDQYLSGSSVVIRKPLPQSKLHSMLAEYDIGLVLEQSNIDLNKDICLANKLFAYVQSGLFVLATNTRGHRQFFEANPHFGVLINQNAESFSKALKGLIQIKNQLREGRKKRFEKGKDFAFRKEMSNLRHQWV